MRVKRWFYANCWLFIIIIDYNLVENIQRRLIEVYNTIYITHLNLWIAMSWRIVYPFDHKNHVYNLASRKKHDADRFICLRLGKMDRKWYIYSSCDLNCITLLKSHVKHTMWNGTEQITTFTFKCTQSRQIL